MGWLYKLYLLIREIVGMRDGTMTEADIQGMVCKLDAFGREIKNKPLDAPVTPEELQAWENSLREINRKCGSKQSKLYQYTERELAALEKAKRTPKPPKGV